MTNNVRVGMTNNVRVGMTSNMYTEHDNSGNVKNSVFLYPMLITIVFILGYLAIVFEHPLKVNKTASALLT